MVTLATLNLLHGLCLDSGRVDAADLRATAAALDVDVVGLQEVDRDQPRSGRVDQAACVAEALGAPYVRFEPSVRGVAADPLVAGAAWSGASLGASLGASWAAWRGGEPVDGEAAYGIALVSRLPVRHWAARRFPAAPVGLPLLVPTAPRPRLRPVADEPRVAIAAVVDLGDGRVATVVTAHLSFVPGYNIRQLRAVARWARTLPAPRLLVGDLNLPGAVPERASGWSRLARAATYPSYRPRVQLDHVLGDGVDSAGVCWVDARRLAVSDHCALRAAVEL